MTKAEQQIQWTDRINEFKASGQNQTEWCKTKKINLRTFNYWFVKSNKTVSQTSKTSNWISLKDVKPNETPIASMLTVKIGHVIVEVKPGFDAKLLLNIVEALSSKC
jgi:hypothetical protein